MSKKIDNDVIFTDLYGGNVNIVIPYKDVHESIFNYEVDKGNKVTIVCKLSINTDDTSTRNKFHNLLLQQYFIDDIKLRACNTSGLWDWVKIHGGGYIVDVYRESIDVLVILLKITPGTLIFDEDKREDELSRRYRLHTDK